MFLSHRIAGTYNDWNKKNLPSFIILTIIILYTRYLIAYEYFTSQTSFPDSWILCSRSRNKAKQCTINLLDVGGMTEMLAEEKEKGSQREAVQQSRKKVDSPTTRTRVIACPEQISDPWLRYGWFIRRGMHRPTNYLRPRRARGPRIEYVQKSPGTASKSFANGSALINSPPALIESNFGDSPC